ncbi:MAG TPA: hypothetical protein VMH04_09765 [Candidatus Solibacter sp.]|nr:hypothetical protein [Candidatus Solibacter sp.]
MINFSKKLAGGDRRSIGNSNELVAAVLQRPELFPKLIEHLWSNDPIVRMRAADAVEKVSVKRPELLQAFKEELLGLADEATQAELRWHLALMLPRLHLTPAERMRAVSTVRPYLDDPSSIVRTCALQGMADLAEGNRKIEAEVVGFLEKALRNGTPAMKARARKLMARLKTK